MKKRWTLLLALALCLTLVAPDKVQAVTTSGSCGESATWSFDEATGTLTISGTGDVDDKDHEPWYNLYDEIKRIVIENGITNIPHGAFSNLRELTEVVIPESVVSIASYAFHGCKNLKSIDLHDGIQELGSSCFEGSGLTEITIPKGVTLIPYSAFRRCSDLTKINFHNAVTQIDSNAFAYCYDLQQVTIPDSVTTIGSHAFEDCYNLQQVIIPDSVTAIQANAFTNCTKLTDVVLSKNLKIIEGGLFRDCSSLKEIEIPDSITEIDSYAFCKSGIEYITLGAGVASIKSSAFDECTNLKAFIVSDFNSHFSVDSANALFNENKTELYFVPKALSGAYTVPAGTKVIKTGAFRNCANLTQVTLPDSLLELGDYAFAECKNLQELKLPPNLQTIGDCALNNCDSLPELVIPASVTKVERGFVASCDKMEYLIFVGQPPEFDDSALNGFSKILYYPSYHTAWKSVNRLLAIKATWVSYDCTDHNVVTDPAKNPSCTEEGSTEGSHCERCGKVISQPQSIPATGHAFGPWKTIQEPTTEKTGLAQRICSKCGIAEDKTLDKLQDSTQTTDPATDPTEIPTDPTAPTEMPTDPTQTPTDAPTEPTQAPTDPTQPDITVKEDPKSFPWAIVVIAVAAIGAAAAGFLLAKKKNNGT